MKVISPYKDKPLLIIGEFNLNLFEYDNNTHIDEFENSMISNSLLSLLIRQQTFSEAHQH